MRQESNPIPFSIVASSSRAENSHFVSKRSIGFVAENGANVIQYRVPESPLHHPCGLYDASSVVRASTTTFPTSPALQLKSRSLRFLYHQFNGAPCSVDLPFAFLCFRINAKITIGGKRTCSRIHICKAVAGKQGSSQGSPNTRKKVTCYVTAAPYESSVASAS